MSLLIVNLLNYKHNSPYFSVISTLSEQNKLLLFADSSLQKILPQNHKAIFCDGSPANLLQVEALLTKATHLLLFVEKTEKNTELNRLLTETRAILNQSISLNKKTIVVSDAHKEVQRITEKNNSKEWRPEKQHGNWVWFQYLLEQEIARARAENLACTLLQHAPLSSSPPPNTKKKQAAYLLTFPTDALSKLLTKNLTQNHIFSNATYFLSKKPLLLPDSRQHNQTTKKNTRLAGFISCLRSLLPQKHKQPNPNPWHIITEKNIDTSDYQQLMDSNKTVHSENK